MQRRFVGSSSRIVGSDREEHEWLDDTLAAKLLKFAGLALLTLGGLWIAIISQGSAGTVLGLASSAFFGGCAYLGLRRIFTKSNRLSKISQWQSRRDIMMAAESGDLETADALAAHDDSAGDAVFRPRVRRHRRPAIEADLPGATAAQTGSRRTS